MYIFTYTHLHSRNPLISVTLVMEVFAVLVVVNFCVVIEYHGAGGGLFPRGDQAVTDR